MPDQHRSATRSRNLVTPADRETLLCVEQRRPMLCLEIERILSQIVLSSHEPWRGTGHIERGDSIQTLRIPIGEKEAEPTGILPGQSQLESMIRRIRFVA